MYLSAAVNVLMDVALVAIAIPNILPLKLPRTQKAALIGVASLSILVTISSIVRVVRVFNLSSSKDFSWDTSDITTWSAIEINVGIFCAAAPAIRPLIRAVIGILGSMNSTDNRRPSNRRYPYGNIDTSGRARAIELSGGETFDATHTKSRFWSKVGAGANISDGDSTKGVLNYKAADTGTGILHTVVVRIDVDSDEERARRDDEDENRNYV
ncbi:hypothetical protein V500_03281 [Pseudogymnoascus sp. VKM F-4518 (FW-2643)]|nr:hypothetical protein V500_03281 [Pseudogymnoascus sp. VKM F-4518 (FW-2643)]